MKMRKGWIKFAGLLSCFWSLSAFGAGSLGEQLQHALNANIPDKALTCFAQEMEVSVMGKGSVCSNEQAVEILRQFMESNPVVSCQILHKGKKMNAGFYILNIVVSSQKRYRIYALERNENNENLIRQFRIDEVVE